MRVKYPKHSRGCLSQRFILTLENYKMRVYIALEFNDIDADSEMADTIINSVTESCERIRIGLNADACWVDDAQNTDDMVSFNNSFNKRV